MASARLFDRYGFARECAAVGAAEAALRGLDETISAALARGNPTPASATARQRTAASTDNLALGAAISASAIRAL
ncbi:hypothetical protein [Lysobacter enzymogenes]|uniref:hypothetical protein n=1 Tax=Lysobacter enzymogenes TaxID=69 RepID=UPI001A979C71|nr:hypothetical protein [Lysobacter enzymogenes]QQP97749.1 hypothetical protein JHW38_06990 [Lysobacter enzymogenes]